METPSKLISRQRLLLHGFIGGKTIDSHYNLLQKIAREPQNIEKKESMYWIAVIDLALINDTDTQYPILFPCGYENALVQDEYAVRDSDGNIIDFAPVYYDFSGLMTELLWQKDCQPCRYLFCLMHETVKLGKGHHAYVINLPDVDLGYLSNEQAITHDVRLWVEDRWKLSRSYAKEDYDCVLYKDNDVMFVPPTDAAVAA